AGSEDSNVYFYDLTRPKHTCVNKLQGHRFPVIGIAWNHGENLLASSDFYGTVIVWKRARTS
ncbi:WD repeat-containing protein 13, partial [Quillaja saponaria]